jgi:hypothetical protein
MHLPCGHGLGNQALEGELLLLEILGSGVLNLELGHGIAESGLNALLVATLELHGHARVGDDLFDTGDVRLELLARLELLGESLVAGLELGSIYMTLVSIGLKINWGWKEKHTINHLVDLSAGELADSVRDGDVGRAAGGLLGGGDLQDTVDVNLEDTLESGLTGAHGRERSESELAQGGVISAVGTLTLVDGELNGLLVVDNSGEGTLLNSGDSLAAVNDGGEDVALHSDTEREGNNVQKEEVLGLGGGGLAGKDTGLDGGTVGNSLIGVDALYKTCKWM